MTSQTVLLGLALLLVALLTAGGMAMRSVSRIWLRHWVEHQLRGAPAALVYLERPQRLIIASSATVALILALSGELLAIDHADDPWGMARAPGEFAVLVIVVAQRLPRALVPPFPPAAAT